MNHFKRAVLASAILSLALCVQPFPAKADGGPCPGLNATLIPMGYQQLTVSSVAVGFTIPQTRVLRLAIVTVEVNPIRFRDDGTAPTASVGMLVQNNVSIAVCGVAASAFRAIRTGSDAVLSISYYGT